MKIFKLYRRLGGKLREREEGGSGEKFTEKRRDWGSG